MRVLHRLVDRAAAALDQVIDQLLELCPGERPSAGASEPLASAVMNGRLMSVDCRALSSFLAFSQASWSRCRAIGSLRRSMPCSRLNSSAT